MMNIQGFSRYAKTLGKFATTFLLALLTQPVFAAAPQTVTYYYTDPQGTVLATTDAQGNILTQADRRPYGEQVMGTPQDGPGYTGHVDDPDSGLIYMQARYYDPVSGRFLSKDPAGFDSGDVFSFSRFIYTKGNPFSYVDPDGKVAIVTQQKDGNVRIQYPVVFIGPESKPENISAIKQQISDMSGTYNVHGKTVSVKFEVTEVSTKLFGGTPGRARNEVKLVSGPTSKGDGRSYAELGGKRAEIDVNDRLVTNGVAPHEFGHLGGVDDLYDKQTGLPDPAKGNSIMNRVPGVVDSDTVQGIIDYTGNIKRVEK